MMIFVMSYSCLPGSSIIYASISCIHTSLNTVLIMDPDNRAMCKLLCDRGLSYSDIAKEVVKKDGSAPKKQAVAKVLECDS